MAEIKDNIHTDHRDRVRQRFLAESLDNFDPHNILELLLFYAIPRKDTNPIAHELMRQFGSLSAVFDADVDQLAAVKGMSRNAAVLIKMVPEIYRKYAEDQFKQINILNSSDLVGEFLTAKFVGRLTESVAVICLNSSCKLLKFEWISDGGFSSASVDLRKIVETAFSCNASNVILAHNHPAGGTKPSLADVRTTELIQTVLKKLEINLLDHFIIGGHQWASMMEGGYLSVDRIVERRLL